MAKTYRPYLPEQDFLLPPSPRDWLPDNHLASFVSELVDELDLSAWLKDAAVSDASDGTFQIVSGP